MKKFRFDMYDEDFIESVVGNISRERISNFIISLKELNVEFGDDFDSHRETALQIGKSISMSQDNELFDAYSDIALDRDNFGKVYSEYYDKITDDKLIRVKAKEKRLGSKD